MPEGEEDLPSVYHNPNGNLLIDFSWWPGGYKPGAKLEFRTLTFFGGALREIDEKEANRFDTAVIRRPGAAIQNANDAIRDYLIQLRREAEQ